MVAEMKIPSMSSADTVDDSVESIKEPLESTTIVDTSSAVSEKDPKRSKKKRTVRINEEIINISDIPQVIEQIVKDEVETDQGEEQLQVLSKPSVDSRDNPFLPGGDLSQEAEDLLKRATIIRDRFILNESNEQIQKCQGDSDSPSKHSPQDGLSDQPVEETISPEVAQSAETTPLTNEKPKENGRFEDSATPESIKLDMSHDQIDGTAITDDTNKDKKKQKKCCVVM